MQIFRMAALAAITLYAAAPTLAQSNETEKRSRWEHTNIDISFVGSGIRRDVRGISYDAEAIYTTETEKAGNVAFICVNGTFVSNVALTPQDFKLVISEWLSSTRVKIRQPTVLINGESIRPTRWTYSPTLQFLLPRKTLTTKKLYNAAIRGDTVQIKMDGKDPLTLVLPKPNVAFADFGAACGLGRNAKKD